MLRTHVIDGVTVHEHPVNGNCPICGAAQRYSIPAYGAGFYCLPRMSMICNMIKGGSKRQEIANVLRNQARAARSRQRLVSQD